MPLPFFACFFGREMCQNEYEVAPKFDPAKCWIPITLHILLLQMVAMERERERERDNICNYMYIYIYLSLSLSLGVCTHICR